MLRLTAGVFIILLHRGAAYDCSLPLDTGLGQCGTSTRCAANMCCSKWGFCGKTEAYCAIDKGCQSEFGMCESQIATCKKTSQTSKNATTPGASEGSRNLSRCPANPARNLIANYYEIWNSPARLPIYSDISFYFVAETTKTGFSLDAESIKRLPAWVQQAKAKGEALLTIGGWTGSRFFSSLVSTAGKRKKFASDIKIFLQKYKLDGVDLDWEYPGLKGIGCNEVNSKDSQHYLAFLEELRTTLNTVSESLLITAAVPTEPFIGTNGKPLKDVSKFAKYLDYIILMAYDVYGAWSETTGPLSPLYSTCSLTKSSSSDAVTQWNKAGFPKCKMLLGVPSYARSFRTTSSLLKASSTGTERSLIYQAKRSATPKGDSRDTFGDGGSDVCGQASKAGFSGTWTYNSMVTGKILSATGAEGLNGFKRYYDKCSETPFLFNAAKKYFITYEDKISLRKKAAFAHSQGLAGVAVYKSQGLSSGIYKSIKAKLSPRQPS